MIGGQEISVGALHARSTMASADACASQVQGWYVRGNSISRGLTVVVVDDTELVG